MKKFLRWAFYAITTLVCLFALAITTARFATLFPHELETFLNKRLTASEILIHGLQTDWRYTNPVISIEKLEFPQGVARDIEVELALVESGLRQSWVARRFIVTTIDISIDLTTERRELNLLELVEQLQTNFEYVRHTDELRVVAKVSLNRGVGRQDWEINLIAINQQGVHRYRGSLTNPTEIEGSLTFALDAKERPIDRQADEYLAIVELHNLPADLPFLTGATNVPAFEITGLARWQQAEERLNGRGELSMNGLGDSRLSLQATAEFERNIGDSLRLLVRTPKVLVDDSLLTLPDWRLSFAEGDLNGSTRIDEVGELLPLTQELLKQDESHVSLITALAPKGSISHLDFSLNESGLQWMAEANDAHLSAHQNVPDLSVDKAKLSGTLTQFFVTLDDANTRLFLPRLFTDPWVIEEVTGDVFLQAQNGSFGVYSPDLILLNVNRVKANTVTPSQRPADLPQLDEETTDLNQFIREVVEIHIHGGLQRAIGGAPDFRTTLKINSASSLIPVDQISDFIPKANEVQVNTWADSYVRSASFFDTELSFLHHTDDVITNSERKFYISGRFANGEVEYLADWPHVQDAQGQWRVTNDLATFEVERAFIQATEITSAMAQFPIQADAEFNVAFSTVARAQDLLDFVQTTEIRDWLPVIHPDWVGSGLIELNANLQFPYDEDIASDLALLNNYPQSIEFTLYDTNIQMPELNIELQNLNGSATWQAPYKLNGSLENGLFFNRPLLGEVFSYNRDGNDVIEFKFQSRVSVPTAEHIAGFDSLTLGAGTTEFDARLLTYPDAELPTILYVNSDLTGIALDLPQPLYKEFDDRIPSELLVEIQPDSSQYELRSLNLNASISLDSSNEISEGVIAIGPNTLMPAMRANELSVVGQLGYWEYEADVATDLVSVPITFEDVQIHQLDLGGRSFYNVQLDGRYVNDLEYELGIQSNEFLGTVSKVPENPNLFIHAQVLNLVSSNEQGGGDPLDLSSLDWLEPTMVRIDNLGVVLDDETNTSWGAWDFSVMPKSNGIEINSLKIDAPGWRLASDLPVWWDKATNRTSFAGTFVGTNLGDALESWGYAPSVQSETFEVHVNFGWPGSPLNVDVERLSGALSANLQSGRFIDIDQGGDVLRIVSLLNFSKIANRLSLDFSDVMQKGLHFDTISLATQWEDGVLLMNEPMEVDGPATDLRITGSVDTRSGVVDSDMKVTIQLHKGFQAAAAYLGATNPPAVLGWLIGSAIMTDPIRRLFTANYEITGTIENPEFVRVFPEPDQSTPVTSQNTE